MREAYKPGYRQALVLFLSSWLVKVNISPLSAVKVVKHLYDWRSGPPKTRLSAAVYSYKRASMNIDSYAGEIEGLVGLSRTASRGK